MSKLIVLTTHGLAKYLNIINSIDNKKYMISKMCIWVCTHMCQNETPTQCSSVSCLFVCVRVYMHIHICIWLYLRPFLLTWINFNPIMDKQLYPFLSVGRNYLSNSKLQRLRRLSLGMDKQFHPRLFWKCEYLCMLRLKLIHVSNGALFTNMYYL